jgi:predicted NUDIX family NTP pyrophosphohydrolase
VERSPRADQELRGGERSAQPASHDDDFRRASYGRLAVRSSAGFTPAVYIASGYLPTVPKTSAGLLLFRRRGGAVELFLVHPGGPFWKNKDAGAWTIPKGEIAEGEAPLDAARREFEEETGFAPDGLFLPLAAVRQASGKVVHAWALEGDLDPDRIRSNTFDLEWPPGSGRVRQVPEVDRGAWFLPDEAQRRINPGQAPLIAELLSLLSSE